MNSQSGSSAHRFVPAIVAAVAALAVGVIFFFFNPEVYHFYPRCPLYETTGLLCPGCGGLRATHQLLHGHIGTAFRLNPLAILLAPVAAWIAIGWFVRQTFGWKWPMPRLHQSWAWVFVAVLVIFGIARNIHLIQARIAGS